MYVCVLEGEERERERDREERDREREGEKQKTQNRVFRDLRKAFDLLKT